MSKNIEELINNLNHNKPSTRLYSLSHLIKAAKSGVYDVIPVSGHVNNHIHTNYSFSPYSPSKAIWMAFTSGLSTAGIMDHDSISGATEFIEAGRIAGMATTIGIECRADFSGTPLNGKRINNPDQDSIAYVAIHGIPHTQIPKVSEFFSTYRHLRNERNKKMIEKINGLIYMTGIQLSFEHDIKPLSKFDEGGSITERHLLYGLSLKLIEKYGMGESLIEALKNYLQMRIRAKLLNLLLDSANPYYDYDLLGLLKSDLVQSFYIDAAEECPPISDLLAFSREIGGISAYAYLGDITDSVTGDKKAQKFEDDYLELVFDTIVDLGFNGVTYMPSRNSPDQLKRLRGLCKKHNLFEISGEDINSPRQSFICEAMKDGSFSNLKDSTWAMIGHEKASTADMSAGMFAAKALNDYPDLYERINVFKLLGM